MGIYSSTRKEKVSKKADVEKQEKVKNVDFSAFNIKVDEYEYPQKGKVPAGYYASEIMGVSVRSKDGKLILDVDYDIYNERDEYKIRQSYPEGSFPLKRLHKAMLEAGLKAGDGPEKYVGVEEKVQIAYPSDESDFGSIVKRVPYVPKEVEADDVIDNDDEFDDFLDGEDE